MPPAAPARAHVLHEEDPFFTDDFVDDRRGDPLTLAPVGPTKRPNGVTYLPRTIGGHEDLALLRHFRGRGEHVLLLGPPGTGKTSMVEAAFTSDATQTHEGLETIVCGVDTNEADFFGTWVQDPATGRYLWVPGPLQRAVTNDVPLLVDEAPLADSRVLASTLYPLMDGRKVLRINANPSLPPLTVGNGFFVIACGNPDVPGAVISDALRDRCHHHIEVGTDWELASELGVPPSIITVARHLDDQRRRGLISWSPQLRALLAYRDSEKTLGRGFALAGLLAKAPDEARPLIGQALAEKFGPVTPLTVGSRDGGLL